MGKLVAVLAALAVVASFALAADGRDLPPSVQQQAAVGNGTVVDVLAGSAAANYDCNYHFEVQTGHDLGAGTDARLTFKLYDQYRNGFSFEISASGHWSSGGFEAGNLDTFDVNMVCFHPCWLIIASDNAGPFPDWECSWVRVTVSGGVHDQHTFHVNRWIGPLTENYQIEIHECHHGMMTAA